jgi:DNA-binding Xre family transcriptional regulator
MSARLAILASIKAVLRARNMPYRDLARAIKVSEATIKRDLSRGTFSLERLDAICAALGVSLSDLLEAPDHRELVTELTKVQEVALAGDPRALVVTYLILGDWKFAEIVAAFEMNENQLIDLLLRLDRLGIIEYRPPHRMRKLTARNFSWRKDGPVHKFFVNRFVPEFFQSGFDAPSDAFRFVGGTLSAESVGRFKASLERLAAEFEQLAHRDSRLPLERRNGCSAILAVRSWEFSEFTRLRRRGG